LSVSRHTHETDAGDLALRVEAEHEARRVTTREDNFDDVECLLSDRAGLDNLGNRRRRPVRVLFEVLRRRLHQVIGELGIVLGRQLRTIDLACLHVGVPFKRKGFHAFLRLHAGSRRRGVERGGDADFCGPTATSRRHRRYAAARSGPSAPEPSRPRATSHPPAGRTPANAFQNPARSAAPTARIVV
jgi:hypothetical protein